MNADPVPPAAVEFRPSPTKRLVSLVGFLAVCVVSWWGVALLLEKYRQVVAPPNQSSMFVGVLIFLVIGLNAMILMMIWPLLTHRVVVEADRIRSGRRTLRLEDVSEVVLERRPGRPLFTFDAADRPEALAIWSDMIPHARAEAFLRAVDERLGARGRRLEPVYDPDAEAAEREADRLGGGAEFAAGRRLRRRWVVAEADRGA